MAAILREVRWELDIRGFEEVNILVSGGLDEASIPPLNPLADAYGVGTRISNAPVIDFSLDIVEIEGAPTAKRGKLSGRKRIWRCANCGSRGVIPRDGSISGCPRCGHDVSFPSVDWLHSGGLARDLPSLADVQALASNEVRSAMEHGAER